MKRSLLKKNLGILHQKNLEELLDLLLQGIEVPNALICRERELIAVLYLGGPQKGDVQALYDGHQKEDLQALYDGPQKGDLQALYDGHQSLPDEDPGIVLPDVEFMAIDHLAVLMRIGFIAVDVLSVDHRAVLLLIDVDLLSVPLLVQNMGIVLKVGFLSATAQVEYEFASLGLGRHVGSPWSIHLS